MKHGQRKEVKRGNTAIKRTSHSVPYRAHIKAGRLQGRILDYGCGRGYDVEALRAQGLDIYGFDRFQPEGSEAWASVTEARTREALAWTMPAGRVGCPCRYQNEDIMRVLSCSTAGVPYPC